MYISICESVWQTILGNPDQNAKCKTTICIEKKFGHDDTFSAATIQHQALLTCNNNTPDILYSVLCLTHLKVSGKPHGPRSYHLQTYNTWVSIYLYGRRDNCIVSPALCHIRRFATCFQCVMRDTVLRSRKFTPALGFHYFSDVVVHVVEIFRSYSLFGRRANTKRKLIQTK